MKARAAAECSPVGIAKRYDENGHCWLFVPKRSLPLLIATDIPDGTEGDVMWDLAEDWQGMVFVHDDWKPMSGGE